MFPSFIMEQKCTTNITVNGIQNGPSHTCLEKAEIFQETVQPELPQIKLDPEETPLNWSMKKKWSATIVVVLMTATITFCSSIHTAAISGVARSFECSHTVATLGVTTFLLGFATGPLLFAPLSEVWGRCLVFRITLFLFFCFNLGCALAPNIAALLVLRFLCGFFGSPTGKCPAIISIATSDLDAVTNSGGCLADMWPQSQRSVPFALFTTGSSLGPVVAPMVGGFISEASQSRCAKCFKLTNLSVEFDMEMVNISPENI